MPRTGNTGAMPRTGSTGSMPRSGNTGAHPRTGNTGAQRRVSSTGQHRRVNTGGTGRIDGTGQARSLGATGSARPLGATGQGRALSPSDTGQYLEAAARSAQTVRALDGTTSSIDTRHSHVKQGGKRKAHQTHHAAPARHRGGMPVWGIILVIVAALGVGVGGFLLVSTLMHPYEGAQVADGQEVHIEIPEGASGSQIVQILLDAGVVHSTVDFRRAVRDQNADQSLKSGSYTFLTGSDPSEVVAQLVAGSNSSEGAVTIPEGLTVTQTAAILETNLGISQDEFLGAAKASAFVDDYPFLQEASSDSLEGFLYPKTYDFAGRDVTPASVITLMLDQFQTEMDSLDLKGAREGLYSRYGLSVTNYDLIKIASIIEKEAINEQDRPLVSSVFYNRLAQHIALQSDATMSYVTDGFVTADDLKKDSPYNTYYYKGLPPTPICTPSGWALEAAMYPADTDYLFFFIIETEVYSNHTFSKTYEEHESAYARALQEMNAAAEAAGSTDKVEGTTVDIDETVEEGDEA